MLLLIFFFFYKKKKQINYKYFCLIINNKCWKKMYSNFDIDFDKEFGNKNLNVIK